MKNAALLTRVWFMALAAALGLAALTRSEAQQPVDSKVVEASLFKNGLAFVVREVDLPSEGEYLLQDLPAPAHGSFWIMPESKATLVKEAVAINVPRSQTTEAVTLIDLLQANIGKTVELQMEKYSFEATIVAVPKRSTQGSPNSANSAYLGYGDRWGSQNVYRPPITGVEAVTEQPGFVLLKSDNPATSLALLPGDIKGLRSVKGQGDLALSFSRSMPGSAIRLKVTGGGGKIRLAYLVWGLTWAPSYQIDITNAKEASLQGKATILNDVEEMRGATANLVTGYPNLAFAEAVDPLGLRGDVSDFLQSLLNLGTPERRRQTPTMAQQVMSNAMVSDSGRPRLTVPTEGEVREDLFLYPQTDVNLKQGERGYYPLFAKRVPYESLFQWEIEDSLDPQYRWRHAYWYDRGDQQMPQQEEVWHTLRLTNTGGLPWTTAPAMTVQEGRVLGQDTLFYTSPGAKSLVKITRAIDVKAEQGETEVERERNAKTAYSGQTYDLVTIKGELRVFNYKNKPITLLIKKTLSGEVLETSPKCGVDATIKGVWRVNPQQLLTWEIPVEAAGKVYLAYRYKVYAAR